MKLITKRIIVCKNCFEKKPHLAFGLCRKCYKIKYRQENKAKIAKWAKEGRKRNGDKIALSRKSYRQNGKKNSVRIERNRTKQYWIYNTNKKVHIAIAEKVLGRRFKPNEEVHHIDGNGLNNLRSNLLICTKSYHSWLHWQIRRQGSYNA